MRAHSHRIEEGSLDTGPNLESRLRSGDNHQLRECRDAPIGAHSQTVLWSYMRTRAPFPETQAPKHRSHVWIDDARWTPGGTQTTYAAGSAGTETTPPQTTTPRRGVAADADEVKSEGPTTDRRSIPLSPQLLGDDRMLTTAPTRSAGEITNVARMSPGQDVSRDA